MRNARANIYISGNPNDKVKLSGRIGLGDLKRMTSHDLLLRGDIQIADLLGMDVSIGMLAIGNSFLKDSRLSEWTQAGYDPFNRPRVNGARSVELLASRGISDSMNMAFKSMINLSNNLKYGQGEQNSKITAQLDLNYGILSSATVNLGYRIESDPNATDPNSDLLIIGMSCKY